MKNVNEKFLSKLFIIAGIIAFLFSFIIMVEKIEVAASPDHVPPCTIDPFVSCTKVMLTPQASVFGFPNPLLGIAGFAIVVALGAALLSDARFKKWLWLSIQAGMTFAVGFIYWLFHEAIYEIGALCLYCMAVWLCTIPLFWYTTRYNLEKEHVSLGKDVKKLATKYSAYIVTAMYLVIFVAILHRHWYYWSSLI